MYVTRACACACSSLCKLQGGRSQKRTMSSLWLHDARCRTLCLQVNIQVNFVFLIVGLMVSSAVPALFFMLTWPAVPRGAAITSALVGQVCAPFAVVIHPKYPSSCPPVLSLRNTAWNVLAIATGKAADAQPWLDWPRLLVPDLIARVCAQFDCCALAAADFYSGVWPGLRHHRLAGAHLPRVWRDHRGHCPEPAPDHGALAPLLFMRWLLLFPRASTPASAWQALL